MSEEQAFLEHLLDHRDDDTTRLVYADWLEERGDERGRYLRLEVELARLAAEKDERYSAWQSELQVLRAGIDPLWLEIAGKDFDVVVREYTRNMKIPVIKVIRQLTDCGLVEGKTISEALPAVICGGVSRGSAELALRLFETAKPSYIEGASNIFAAILCASAGTRRPYRPKHWLPPPQTPLALRLVRYAPEDRLLVIAAIRRVRPMSLHEARSLAETPSPVRLRLFWNEENARTVSASFAGVAEVDSVPLDSWPEE